MKRSYLSLAFLLLPCACGSSSNQADAGPATVTISGVATNGSTIRNDDTTANGVTLTVTTTGITLVDPLAHRTDVPGEGHFHIFFDSDPTYLALAFTSPVQVAIPSRVTGSAGGTAHTLHVVLETNTHLTYPNSTPSNNINISVVQ